VGLSHLLLKCTVNLSVPDRTVVRVRIFKEEDKKALEKENKTKKIAETKDEKKRKREGEKGEK
jgi:hypothetical protein